ncbi:hypothetical protein BOTBODRAFT_281195 [Botryobasidium botryosum FD-172 SS1]|uniref:F-box domain-containing protein n=1 Tax=Botryobasidium botryosum (strain FD-172 SS1) TaxID=930990 RepID=A0A067MIE1_BOTB1|nr:hypothetical protein BOTBODRAFT_281195 [Botryobasidium botryosum FD-172 SS1]
MTELDRELPFAPTCLFEAIDPFPGPFPNDILITVFGLACVDGSHNNRTAGALCLSSRLFRALTHPLLFRHVAIRTPKQAIQFSALLEGSPQISRCLRHLFLCDNGPPRDEACRDGTCHHRLWLSILRSAAPFLETLSLVHWYCTHCDIEPQYFNTNFPYLRELTLSVGNEVRFSIPFPSLRRFHLHTSQPGVVIVALIRTCPCLTHLKVTGLRYGSRLLYERLKYIWSTTPDSRNHLWGPFFRLPPSLSRNILQYARPSDGQLPDAEARQKSVTDSLIELANMNPDRGLIIEKPMIQRKLEKRFFAAWLDRVSGGEGPWAAQGSA